MEKILEAKYFLTDLGVMTFLEDSVWGFNGGCEGSSTEHYRDSAVLMLTPSAQRLHNLG